MAEVPYEDFGNSTKGSIHTSWSGLTAGDTGQPKEAVRYRDRTIQIFGDFGDPAGVVKIEGSNDPRVITDPGNAVWVTLRDVDLTEAASTSANAMFVLAEAPRWIRPSVVGGTGVSANIVLNAVWGN